MWYNGLQGYELGERTTVADTVATIADYFGVKSPQHGESYLNLTFIPERSLPLLSEAKVGDEFRSSHNLKLFLKTFSY